MKDSRLKGTWEILRDGQKSIMDYKHRQFMGLSSNRKVSSIKPVEFNIKRFNLEK